MPLLTDRVRDHVLALGAEALPAYVYDLDHLRAHAEAIRGVLPEELELFYAAKANPEPAVLRAVAGVVDGYDVSSGGELAHVRAAVPDLPLAFSGPGKTPGELAAALASGVERVHVESLHELEVLDALATRPVDVLLRVNLAVPDGALDGNALAMGGSATPFGLDPAGVEKALRRCVRGGHRHLRVRGVHAHLASGLTAERQVDVARFVVGWAAEAFADHGLPLREVNLGGGMAVDYRRPDERFDWAAYGVGLRTVIAAHPGVTLRIEPGRAISVYSGWYATDVIDVKASHGREFAVVRGGTHHLRTPATKGHDQPCELLPVRGWPVPWGRPGTASGTVDLVGQLCTPKDLLARGVPAPEGLRAGDRVVFALAGAYAWNISHHGFLMHPSPGFHFLGGRTEA